MYADIYSTTRSNTFLAIPAGTPPPEQFAPSGDKTVRPFKRAVPLMGTPPIVLDTTKVVSDLNHQGWSLIVIRVHVRTIL